MLPSLTCFMALLKIFFPLSMFPSFVLLQCLASRLLISCTIMQERVDIIGIAIWLGPFMLDLSNTFFVYSLALNLFQHVPGQVLQFTGPIDFFHEMKYMKHLFPIVLSIFYSTLVTFDCYKMRGTYFLRNIVSLSPLIRKTNISSSFDCSSLP